MSINPVQGIGPIDVVQLAEKNPPPAPRISSPDQAESAQPDPGIGSKKEIPNVRNTSASSELPEDEVQVQQDSRTDGKIVIKYMDHSGHLILQVPSSQILGLARAIDVDLQQAAEQRAVSAAEDSGKGEKTHGH